MKLGIFADPHYSSALLTCGRRYNSRSLAKIEAALARFAAERCDLVVCLGDLIDREDDIRDGSVYGSLASKDRKMNKERRKLSENSSCICSLFQ